MRIFGRALAEADAARALRRHFVLAGDHLAIDDLAFDLRKYRRISLIAAGKAAAPMAQAVEEILGDRLSQALVVTKYGHAAGGMLRGVIIESGHPLPDEAGEGAARAVADLARALDHSDLLLVAISGGASALLPAPVPPIDLRAKQATTDLLLRAGANIDELNTVRKHLSFLKGGQLAMLAYPATVASLLLSDVVGDAIEVIGSGPTAPDETTYAEALTVLARFELLARVPSVVRVYLDEGAQGIRRETPKVHDFAALNAHNIIIGSNRLALAAAAEEAAGLGYRTTILSSTIEGETRTVAALHAQSLRDVVDHGHPVAVPACVLSGGETTVTVRAAGKGGRNQEFALAAAIGIEGLRNALVLSAGTDGTDGPTDAAGAIATGTTIARAEQLQISAQEYLDRHDSYRFFDALGDLIRTGPTGTNVMDVHIMLAGSG